jgi:hypothetical protein
MATSHATCYNSSVVGTWITRAKRTHEMTYRGHVQNGTVVLDDVVVLPEGAAVQVDVLAERGELEVVPTLLERLQSVIGKAQGLPPDASQNVDHYLYGQDKR